MRLALIGVYIHSIKFAGHWKSRTTPTGASWFYHKLCFDLELICDVPTVPYIGISTYGKIGYFELIHNGQIHCKNTNNSIQSMQYTKVR